MKKVLLVLIFGLVLLLPTSAYAQKKDPVKIYLFYGETCPHCHELLEWFSSIESDYGDMYELIKYEVWYDESNSILLSYVASYTDLDISGVPFMLVGNGYFTGFSPEEDPEIIIKVIKQEYEKDPGLRVNIVDEVITQTGWTHDSPGDGILTQDDSDDPITDDYSKEDEQIQQTSKKEEEKEPIYNNPYFRLVVGAAIFIVIIVIGKKTIYIS